MSTANVITQNALRGQLYEINLATLFLIRATKLGYQFEMAMGNDQLGGKFDDLIFRYQIENGNWRYRYLQAKHKANTQKEKIDAHQLLAKPKGEFLLSKYFQSFYQIVQRGDDVEDCVICTNIDIDKNDLHQNGIDIEYLIDHDPILNFDAFNNNQKNSFRCKLKFTSKHLIRQQMAAWSQIHSSGQQSAKKMKIQIPVTQQLMQDFLDKLVFVVNSPNEEDFDRLFELSDMREFYPEVEAKIQTTLMVKQVENWVKNPNRKIDDWLTPAFGVQILLSGVDQSCIAYQHQLMEESVGFNDDAVARMANQIHQHTPSDSSEDIMFVSSSTPKWTAVQVISAIQSFNNKDNKMWVISNRQLANENQIRLWKNRIALANMGPCQHFLVVVRDSNCSIGSEILFVEKDSKELILNKRRGKVKIINVGQSGPTNNIQFKDLDEKTQDVVLSREIIFQEMDDSGTARKAVKNLIPIDPGLRNEILDSASLQELWNSDKTIQLPTIDTRQFSESMYQQTNVLFNIRRK